MEMPSPSIDTTPGDHHFLSTSVPRPLRASSTSDFPTSSGAAPLPVWTGRVVTARARGATFFAAVFLAAARFAGAGFAAALVAAGLADFFAFAAAVALRARARCVVFFVAILTDLLVGADIALSGDRSRDVDLQG
jgi:hypothetical protein